MVNMMMKIIKNLHWRCAIVLLFLPLFTLTAQEGFRAALTGSSSVPPAGITAPTPGKRFTGYGQNLSASHRPGWKSPGKAALLSFLLPGLGEYYVGAKNWARVFLGLEAAALISWYGNVWYANRLEKDYQAYAAQHAGVRSAGKDLAYWTAVGKYDDIYAYNDQRERDRNFAELYPETDEYYWKWDAHQNRLTYDGKRLDANRWHSYEVYFQLAVVLNHLVSGINAIRLARRHNKGLPVETSWHLQLESAPPASGNGYYGLRFTRRF